MKSVLTYKPGALFEHLLPPSLRPLDQEDDESDDEVDDAPPPPQNKGKGKAKDTGASRAGTGRKQAADAKKPAKANKGKKKALQADLTSDDDDAVEEVPPPKNPPKKTAGKSRKKDVEKDTTAASKDKGKGPAAKNKNPAGKEKKSPRKKAAGNVSEAAEMTEQPAGDKSDNRPEEQAPGPSTRPQDEPSNAESPSSPFPPPNDLPYDLPLPDVHSGMASSSSLSPPPASPPPDAAQERTEALEARLDAVKRQLGDAGEDDHLADERPKAKKLKAVATYTNKRGRSGTTSPVQRKKAGESSAPEAGSSSTPAVVAPVRTANRVARRTADKAPKSKETVEDSDHEAARQPERSSRSRNRLAAGLPGRASELGQPSSSRRGNRNRQP